MLGFSGTFEYRHFLPGDCRWRLYGTFGFKMIIKFHMLPNAHFGDSVTVRDRDSSGTVIASLSRGYEDESVVSCSKSLFVEYNSSYRLHKAGVVASFISVGKMRVNAECCALINNH